MIRTEPLITDGLSGWLSPEGVFYSCQYMRHGDMAMQIVNGNTELRQQQIKINVEQGTILPLEQSLKMMDWIVMGCSPYQEGTGDYIFFPLHDPNWKCSNAQHEWFEQNKNSMRTRQFLMYKAQKEREQRA